MFELLNVKWGDPTFGTPSGEITWSSELNGDLPIAPGFDLDDIENSLRLAFDAWEGVAAVDFQEVSSGGAVTISNAALDWPTVGLAGPFPIDRADFLTMTSAEVRFSDNLVDPGTGDTFTWSPFGGGGTIDFFAIAVHEIGHVIGLDHPNDPTQIMNATVSVDELGGGDIQGAQFVYGTDGDDVPVDPGQPDNAEEIGLGGGGGSVSGGGGGGGGGLVLGLLAFIAALFTGGSSIAALAAGRVAMEADEDAPPVDVEGGPEPEDFDISEEDLLAIFNGHQHCDHVGADGMVYHGVTAPGFLPSVDFTQQPNPCGCVGLCEHIIDREEPDDSVLI